MDYQSIQETYLPFGNVISWLHDTISSELILEQSYTDIDEFVKRKADKLSNIINEEYQNCGKLSSECLNKICYINRVFLTSGALIEQETGIVIVGYSNELKISAIFPELAFENINYKTDFWEYRWSDLLRYTSSIQIFPIIDHEQPALVVIATIPMQFDEQTEEKRNTIQLMNTR